MRKRPNKNTVSRFWTKDDNALAQLWSGDEVSITADLPQATIDKIKTLAKRWKVSQKTIVIWALCEALSLTLLMVSPPAIADDLKPAIKPSFKTNHPRIYKGFRKIRTVCIFVGPVVNVAANLTTAIGVLF